MLRFAGGPVTSGGADVGGFKEVDFPAGSTIFRTGDAADCLYVVQQGEVLLFDAEGGRLIAKLHPGEPFGEQAVLSGGVRSADAVAQGAVRCLELTAAGLQEILDHEDGLMQVVFQALLLQLYTFNQLRLASKGD